MILVTAHGTVETAASARRLGVFDYLAKPFEVATLVERVHAALHRRSDDGAEVELGPESLIVGSDPAIVEVYNAVARVAPLTIPVLVRGASMPGESELPPSISALSRRNALALDPDQEDRMVDLIVDALRRAPPPMEEPPPPETAPEPA